MDWEIIHLINPQSLRSCAGISRKLIPFSHAIRTTVRTCSLDLTLVEKGVALFVAGNRIAVRMRAVAEGLSTS